MTMMGKSGRNMWSPTKNRTIKVGQPPEREEIIEEEPFKLHGMMKIVGDKFRDKLRAHLEAVRADKNGKADWFAKKNEKIRQAHVESETKRIREMNPMMKDPESGRQVPAYNYDYSFWQYFQNREK